MVVCVCRGVTDREIRQAVDEGAVCLPQLEARCIGDRCGMCVESLGELIEGALSSRFPVLRDDPQVMDHAPEN